MDFTPIIFPLLKSFWWLIPIFLVIAFFKSSIGKGWFGELQVRFLSWLLLDKKIYHKIHNVTLPTLDGTTQIDHVIISQFGIFVLETKNMTGWIFGGENQPQWTQRIYKQTFKFQNPLRQNFKHVKALELALQIPADTIHSVVTFIGGSTFKTPMPPNVTWGAGFISYIKSFRELIFSESQVTKLLESIQSGRLAPTLATHQIHVHNLKSRSDLNAERRCPKCGNPLVLRKAKSGPHAGEQFWGCSAYPKCKTMQNIT
ncbi:MAG: NERD domain-containing protein [Desulfobulbus sp.]|nr:NERD domain-containing protein [Desulfobulbus sp.]